MDISFGIACSKDKNKINELLISMLEETNSRRTDGKYEINGYDGEWFDRYFAKSAESKNVIYGARRLYERNGYIAGAFCGTRIRMEKIIP